jgi:AAA+ ATPase superfamily predicted ATPase
MKNPINPFPSSIYKGPAYFCNRVAETKQINQLISNGAHIALFAIRRLGKTGLIHHVFNGYKSNKKIVCIYVDILATKNMADFTNLMATAVYNRFPVQNTLGKKIAELFKRFRPTITFDELSGTPSLSLTIDTKSQKENTIGQIFQFLDKQKIKVVFAIDEFQQILEYPEGNTEAILRTQIQQLKNTSFIFCGSNQKMMHQIFNSAKRPFFASCTNLTLDYIAEKDYKLFIKKKLQEQNRKIDNEALDFICRWTGLHTFYTQHFCFTLFTKNIINTTIKEVHETAIDILKLNESTFFQYKNLLTAAQWNLLRAIACEEKVYQPQSKLFIGKYLLGTPALVKRGLDALLEKEMIFYQSGVEKPYYEVYDKFLMRWLQHK